MKQLKRQYNCKQRFKVKSQHTDKYFDLICDIIFRKYKLTRLDLMNRNGGIGFIISKAKSIICFILRSEKKYSLVLTSKIFNTQHAHIYQYLKMHDLRIKRNDFGYNEMFLDILAAFLYEVGNIKNDKTCNSCVVLGFERFKQLKTNKRYGIKSIRTTIRQPNL